MRRYIGYVLLSVMAAWGFNMQSNATCTLYGGVNGEVQIAVIADDVVLAGYSGTHNCPVTGWTQTNVWTTTKYAYSANHPSSNNSYTKKFDGQTPGGVTALYAVYQPDCVNYTAYTGSPYVCYHIDLDPTTGDSYASANKYCLITAGTTITITAYPEAGKSVSAWDVRNQSTNAAITPTATTETTFQFTMPAGNVTANVSFVCPDLSGETLTITPSEMTSTSITMDWAIDGATQYLWELADNAVYASATEKWSESDLTTTHAEFSGLTPNKTYWFKVLAGNSCGETTQVEQISFTTLQRYTISYDNNTGSGSIASVTVDAGGSTTLPSSGMTKDGYTLNNWRLNNAASGTEYAKGATYSPVNANATFYAQWQTESYTITYNNMTDATNHGDNPAEYTIESSAITLQEPTKAGHAFGGWYIDAGLNTPAGIPTIAAGSTGNKIFYARWSVEDYNVAVAGVENVTIKATPAGGSDITETSNADVAYGTEVTLNYSGVTGGNSFYRWQVTKQSDGTDVTNTLVTGKNANNAVLTVPDYAVTVSAVLFGGLKAWCGSEVRYYVTDGDGGYTLEHTAVADDGDVPAYEPVSGCGGKVFVGWSNVQVNALQQTEPALVTRDGAMDGTVTQDTALYAVFAAKNGLGELNFADDFNGYDAAYSYQNTTAREYGIWSVLNGTVSDLSDVTTKMGSKAVILQWNNNGTPSTMTTTDKIKGFTGIDCQIATTHNDVAFEIQYSTNKVSWTNLLLSTTHYSYRGKTRYSRSLLEPQDVYVRIFMSASNTGSGYRAYIDDVTLYSEPHPWYYTDYSTTCEKASAPVALTWAGIDGSTIETGTEPENVSLGTWLTLPVLSKDNYRFDGWKVTINGEQKADVYIGGETFLINHPVTFTAQWTEMFEVSDPAYGVTSYKDITTTSETFTMTVKGTHSITPVVDGLSDDTHFAVTIVTPGTDDGDDTDFNYTFTYTPDAFGTGSGAATHTATFRFKDEASGALSSPVTIRGRSLPEEFVVAVKNNGKWYALPGNLQHTSAQPAIVPVEITVNDNTTPTAALLAPQTAVYKAANRYTPANTTALRFTVTGSNWLQVSGVEGTYNMWLSETGGTGVQDWQLHSADFNAYELTIPSNAYPTKKMGIYNGSYMGYHTSPSNSQIYLLPVDAEYTPREAKVKEWGRYAVVVEVATAGIATVKAHIDNAAPTSALTPQPVNVATIAGAKNLLVNTVNAIDFSAQEGHSLYLDWYDSSDALIATSQISVPLIIAEDKTMSSIDAVKTHWEKKEVHVLPGAKFTADANTYASGNVAVKTLEVYPNATLHVSAGTLNTTDLNLRCGWTRANGKDYDVARVFINSSAALSKTHAAMQYDIFDGEEGNHYYPLAVPFSTSVSTIDYADDYLAGFSTYGTHYVIKDYDGALRAENGVIDENWRVVASDGTLQPGHGYIITAVAVKGEALIRIPLNFDNAWTSDGEKATVDAVTKNVVSVVAHTGAASAGESANNRRHAGWNMLGVPFMSCYTAGTDMYDADALIKGNIVIVGGSEGFAYQNTSVPYVSVPSHNFAEYIQTDITDAKLLPGWSFFVQVGTGGNLTFSVAKQRTDSDTPLYAPQRNDDEHTTVRAALVLAGNGSKDKTTLIIGDRYEAASYEIGADLEKMFGNGYTLAAYTVMDDGTRLVFNAMNTQDLARSIPVGFRAPEAGEYRFMLDDSYRKEDFERLELIDHKLGTLTDLLEDTYTFTTDRTQDDTRFAINAVVRRQPDIPAATDCVSGSGTKAEKRIQDGCLIIIRDGRIYDATGKLKAEMAE